MLVKFCMPFQQQAQFAKKFVKILCSTHRQLNKISKFLNRNKIHFYLYMCYCCYEYMYLDVITLKSIRLYAQHRYTHDNVHVFVIMEAKDSFVYFLTESKLFFVQYTL